MIKMESTLFCSCELCDFGKSIQNKIIQMTNSEQPETYVCQIADCQEVFSSAAILIRHVKTHTDKHPFACTWESCDKKFTRINDLNRHMVLHTGEKPHKCDFCDKEFVRRDYLRKHIRLNHDDDPNSIKIKEKKKEENERRSYICKEPSCNKKFKSAITLKKHKSSHSNIRLYACDWESCNMTFARLESLKRHRIRHTGEKKYRCTECKKKFARQDYLASHLRSHAYKRARKNLKSKPESEKNETTKRRRRTSIAFHLRQFLKIQKDDTKKLFTCSWNQCSKSFSRLNSLIHHIKRVHAKIDDDIILDEEEDILSPSGTTIWVSNSNMNPVIQLEDDDPLAQS